MKVEDPGMVWVEDRRWWVDATPHVLTCSFPGCDQSTVAGMRRQRTNAPHGAEYHYCPAHLYGRMVAGGKVWMRVREGSPAAERGYVD